VNVCVCVYLLLPHPKVGAVDCRQPILSVRPRIEGEREYVCVCVREKESECVCVCLFVAALLQGRRRRLSLTPNSKCAL